ncbi:hypothetical protein B0H17DRAFT_1127669 [Mycena rosella]|uniref:Uncharacterized protein n=1 Tax=Mycena rosella TaxID=1033263 RepID=A0AAD7E163_MYCRO|nr:hypothetical protein B0H17DRAFT_1127669 [Mycena rosella]
MWPTLQHIQPTLREVLPPQVEHIGVRISPTSRSRDYPSQEWLPPYQLNEHGRARISLGSYLYCEGALLGIIIPRTLVYHDKGSNQAVVWCEVPCTGARIGVDLRYTNLRWEIPALPDHPDKPALGKEVGGTSFIPPQRFGSATRDAVAWRLMGGTT